MYKYPLCTKKYADFLLLKKAFYLVKEKAFLTHEGLNQIINLKSSMNLGLSDIIKSDFPNYIPVERPQVIDNIRLSPYWLSGFISVEGNFDVHTPCRVSKLGYRVNLRFRITQDIRYINLMEKIVKFMKCGKIYKYGGKSAVCFSIVDFNDITHNLIPFI